MSSVVLPTPRHERIAADREAARRAASKSFEKTREAGRKASAWFKDTPDRMTQTYRDMPPDEHTWTIGSVSHNRKGGVKDTRDEEERERSGRRNFQLMELRPPRAGSQPPPGGDPLGPSYHPAPTSLWRKASNRFFYGTHDGPSDGSPILETSEESRSYDATASINASPAQSSEYDIISTASRTDQLKARSLPVIRVEEIRDEDIRMPFPTQAGRPRARAPCTFPLPASTRDGSSEHPVQDQELHVRFASDHINDPAAEHLIPVHTTTAAIPPTPPVTPATRSSAGDLGPSQSTQNAHIDLPAESREATMVTGNQRRLRKIRSALLGEPVLKAILGRQLAEVVKPALAHLSEGGTLGIHEVPSSSATSSRQST